MKLNTPKPTPLKLATRRVESLLGRKLKELEFYAVVASLDLHHIVIVRAGKMFFGNFIKPA